MHLRTSLASVVALSLLGAVGCHHHSDQLGSISLAWRGADPKVTYKDSVLAAMSKKHLGLAMVDARTDKSVGKYEDEGQPHVISTSDDVAKFCIGVVADRMKPLGINFVGSGQDFTLKGDITKFFVAEGSNYDSEVDIKFSLVSPDGKEAWSQPIIGKISRWGSSHNGDNYNEGLSIAFDDALKQLMTSAYFEAALLGQPPPEPEAPVLPPPQLPKGAPTLKLEWRGVDLTKPAGTPGTLGAIRATTLTVTPLKDGRTDPNTIGRYDNAKGAIVYTPDNVATFYTKVLTERLKTQGAQLSPSGAYTLGGEILELIVVEGDNFQAVARVRFTVTKAGATVFTAVVEGKGQTHGKDHKAENLNEALSAAYDEMMRSLMGNADLTAALKK